MQILQLVSQGIFAPLPIRRCCAGSLRFASHEFLFLSRTAGIGSVCGRVQWKQSRLSHFLEVWSRLAYSVIQRALSLRFRLIQLCMLGRLQSRRSVHVVIPITFKLRKQAVTFRAI